MKIKSITDVITNSSSEVYIVKTTLDEIECRELFDKVSREMEPDSYELCKGMEYTLIPSIEKISSDTVEFNWDILCNLNNARGILAKIFGENNIVYEG